MKTYVNPMLQIVGINKSDIIVTSPNYNPNSVVGNDVNASNNGVGYAPGRFDSWYEGY